jgi:hypothetical protein
MNLYKVPKPQIIYHTYHLVVQLLNGMRGCQLRAKINSFYTMYKISHLEILAPLIRFYKILYLARSVKETVPAITVNNIYSF